jgi:hypothetical protein
MTTDTRRGVSCWSPSSIHDGLRERLIFHAALKGVTW